MCQKRTMLQSVQRTCVSYSSMRSHQTLTLKRNVCSQARQLIAWGAEGVIVGSALVKALAAGATPAKGVRSVGELARKIRAAT